jgi:acyl carrier protein
MDQDPVFQRLKALVGEMLGQPPVAFAPSTALADLGLDSVERVELLAQLEDAFDVAIPTADAIHLTTVDAVVRYLTARI